MSAFSWKLHYLLLNENLQQLQTQFCYCRYVKSITFNVFLKIRQVNSPCNCLVDFNIIIQIIPRWKVILYTYTCSKLAKYTALNIIYGYSLFKFSSCSWMDIRLADLLETCYVDFYGILSTDFVFFNSKVWLQASPCSRYAKNAFSCNAFMQMFNILVNYA